MKKTSSENKARKPKVRKNQVKGGSCINTQRCNVNKSDNHNDRTGPISNENIRIELTPNNFVWKAPEVPSLPEHLEKIKEDFAHTERKMRKNGQEITYTRTLPVYGSTQGAPIKESILVLPLNRQNLEDIVMNVVRRISDMTRMTPIRVYIHADEIFVDPDSGIETCNMHAHIVWDAYDWGNHEVIKLNKTTLRQMQDIASEETGMPRGMDARETGARHKNVHAYKAQEERKRCQELTQRKEFLETEIESIRERKKTLCNTLSNQCEQMYKGVKLIAEMSLRLSQSLSSESKPSPEEEDLRAGIEKLCERNNTAAGMDAISLLLIMLQRLLQIIIKKIKSYETIFRKTILSNPVLQKSAKDMPADKEMRQELIKVKAERDAALGEAERAAEALEQLKSTIPEIQNNARHKGREEQQKLWDEWYKQHHTPLVEEHKRTKSDYNRLIQAIKDNNHEELLLDIKPKGKGIKMTG